jgi:ribosomal protein S18 acetylase RimI-like enzyme
MAESPTWTIREATADDAATLALIGSTTFLETFAERLPGFAIVAHCARAHAADTYTQYLANGGRAWLCEIEPGAAPIGYALVTAPDLPGAAVGDIELKRIYTLSRFHGSGVGAALMDVALTAASGHRRLLLGVYAQNFRAVAFYKKQGFVPVGERQFDIGGTLHDDLVLAKPLAA